MLSGVFYRDPHCSQTAQTYTAQFTCIAYECKQAGIFFLSEIEPTKGLLVKGLLRRLSAGGALPSDPGEVF